MASEEENKKWWDDLQQGILKDRKKYKKIKEWQKENYHKNGMFFSNIPKRHPLAKYVTDLVPVMVDNIEIPGYFINPSGDLYSTRKANLNRYSRLDKQTVCYSGELKQIFGTGSKYTLYRIKIKFSGLENTPKYRDISSAKSSGSKKRALGLRPDNPRLGIQAHTLVMETFKPFELHLPPDLEPFWGILEDRLGKEYSDTTKRYMKEAMTVDHDDGNGMNNHVSNLEYMTMGDNARKGVRDRFKHLEPEPTVTINNFIDLDVPTEGLPIQHQPVQEEHIG